MAQGEGAHHGIAAIEAVGEPVEEQVLPQSWGLALGMAARQAGGCCLSSHPGPARERLLSCGLGASWRRPEQLTGDNGTGTK